MLGSRSSDTITYSRAAAAQAEPEADQIDDSEEEKKPLRIEEVPPRRFLS